MLIKVKIDVSKLVLKDENLRSALIINPAPHSIFLSMVDGSIRVCKNRNKVFNKYIPLHLLQLKTSNHQDYRNTTQSRQMIFRKFVSWELWENNRMSNGWPIKIMFSLQAFIRFLANIKPKALIDTTFETVLYLLK